VALNQTEVRLPLEPLPGGGVEKGHPKPLARSEKPTVRGKTFYVLCEAQGAYRMSGLTERPTSAADWDRPLRHVPFQQNRSPPEWCATMRRRTQLRPGALYARAPVRTFFFVGSCPQLRTAKYEVCVGCECALTQGGASHWLNSGEVGKGRDVEVWLRLRRKCVR